MELLKWANGRGQTLKLTQGEIEELLTLLEGFVQGYAVTQESTHFIVEREDE